MKNIVFVKQLSFGISKLNNAVSFVIGFRSRYDRIFTFPERKKDLNAGD